MQPESRAENAILEILASPWPHRIDQDSVLRSIRDIHRTGGIPLGDPEEQFVLVALHKEGTRSFRLIDSEHPIHFFAFVGTKESLIEQINAHFAAEEETDDFFEKWFTTEYPSLVSETRSRDSWAVFMTFAQDALMLNDRPRVMKL